MAVATSQTTSGGASTVLQNIQIKKVKETVVVQYTTYIYITLIACDVRNVENVEIVSYVERRAGG